jgi:hypothetical protein
MTRTALVLLCVALLGVALLGMRRGWHNRTVRQSELPALPPVPGELGAALLRSEGLYVGTAFATSWQDRVVHEGLGRRAGAEAVLHAGGLLVERDGAEAIFVPTDTWIAARLAPGLAGKVMGDGGLLVLRWRLGDAELDTAFRADNKTTYPAWIAAINERVSAA